MSALPKPVLNHKPGISHTFYNYPYLDEVSRVEFLQRHFEIHDDVAATWSLLLLPLAASTKPEPEVTEETKNKQVINQLINKMLSLC